MAKNIILLSDGTGNAAAKVWRTNVWRLFQAVDLTSNTQIAIYDDGVGTSSFKPLAILGGAFGWGLKRNVIEIYKFACRNYAPGDKLFGFGFSRGAFTIRIVVGLILNQGLVNYSDEAELDKQARAAYRAYRHEKYSPYNLQFLLRAILNLFDKRFYKPKQRTVPSFDFVGVWDTVAAYGLPVDEMTRGVDRWIWPLELPNTEFNPAITKARHALAIDEERQTFSPVLWDEDATNTQPAGTARTADDERLLQVWFAGVHSNAGGGYPDDSLANVSLTWMMAEAAKSGLIFKTMHDSEPDGMLLAASARDKDGRLYDSRSGLGSYYRYGPRKVADLYKEMPERAVKAKKTAGTCIPKIHESVFGRLKLGAHFYAPIGLPGSYEVVSTSPITVDYTVTPPVVRSDGSSIQANVSPPSEGGLATGRHAEQEDVWDSVWRKRVLYFCTIAATAYLLLYPLLRDTFSYEEVRTRLRLVSDTIRMIGAVVPKFFDRWVDAYAHEPGWFLVCCSIVVLLTLSVSGLSATIKNNMRVVWERSMATGKPAQISSSGAGIFSFLAYAVLVVLSVFPLIFPRLPWVPVAGQNASYFDQALLGLEAYTSAPVWIFLLVFLIARLTPGALVRTLRTSAIYQWLLQFLKWKVFPLASALGLLILLVGLISHYAFSLADSFGLVCKASPKLLTAVNNGFEKKDGKNIRKFTFDISNAASGQCLSTQVRVEPNKKYRVAIVRDGDQWTFFGKPSFMGSQKPSLLPFYKQVMLGLMMPARRIWDRDWNAVILRINPTGSEEDYFDRPDPPQSDDYFPGQKDKPSDAYEAFGEGLTPKREGELFIYVNKPVIGSWLVNPTGKAEVTISEPFDPQNPK